MMTDQAQGAAIFSNGHGLSARFPDDLRRFVTTGTTLSHRTSENRSPPLPTSILQLDRTLAGGLPRGCLIEVTGKRSSGRFSLALSALAATTARGDVAALVDLGNGLDPTNALEMGVELGRLLWLRPRHLKPALAATEIALQTGFPLVVLDLGEPPIHGGRGPEAAWLRLTRAAATHRSVVFVSSPYRVSGTAANTVFETEHAVPRWRGDSSAPRLLETLEFHWRLQKAGNNAVNRRVSFVLTAPNAFLGRKVVAPPHLSSNEAEGEKTVERELDRYRAM